jgi:pilus assembly protein TadC
MRAWQLGAIIAVIGVIVLLYASTYSSIFDPNFFNILLIGFLIFLLGIAILGIKFRQWIEQH